MISVAPASLRGLVPALVTPFMADDPGRIDERALARLVERAHRRGAAAIAVCGSTGEAPALSAAEHARIIACAVEAAHGAMPVIAGVGAPCTETAVALAVAAERCGAAMLLASAPPYSKPGQAGLRAHIRAVASATGLAVML
ncbi:MAG TPA: dihydrodipicolinate synthase family protein, partial [Roseomonas sp.]